MFIRSLKDLLPVNKFEQLQTAMEDKGINFDKDGFYYPFRKAVITRFCKALENPAFFKYVLRTIAWYMMITDGPALPYKLLIGRKKGASTIKEVSSNDDYRVALLTDTVNNIKTEQY